MLNVAILTNSSHSYPKPLAEGLQRMLSQLGVESRVFYDGYEMLYPFPRGEGSRLDALARGVQGLLHEARFRRFVRRLRAFDLIVLVAHLPGSFMREHFVGLERLRDLLPGVPIVNYDMVYLPTCGIWPQLLKDGNNQFVKQGNNFGLERYDWYLSVSVVSERPMPRSKQPYHQIGCNLDDGSLRWDQKKDFTAVLDFEVPAHLKERGVQIQALEDTNTKYVVLQGRYPRERIREIYRECSLFFVAKRESFGLPICEVQACGGLIFTPYAEWCPAHWIKADLHQARYDSLSPNFRVYGNDRSKLIEQIRQARKEYDPEKVFRSFVDCHPRMYSGDLGMLNNFLDMVAAGAIHGRLHREHTGLLAEVLP